MSKPTEKPHSAEGDALLESVLNAPHFDDARFAEALDKGADPNWKDAKGRPLLHLLTAKGQASAMEQALAAGADVNATDDHGATALFEAFLEHPLLILLKAGASPQHRNHIDITAATFLPREHTGLAYRQLVMNNARLLNDCEEIERAANNGTLSAKTWEGLWPNNAFGPSFVPTPSTGTLVYFLHKMEESGQFMPKEMLSNKSNGGSGLRKALKESELAVMAWQDHCDKSGSPVTPDEWQMAGTFNGLAKEQKLACLFTAKHWAQKPSLKDFVALAEALPDHAWKNPKGRLQSTISETMCEWAEQGGGKDLSAKELRDFRSRLPEQLKDLFSSFHMLCHARENDQTAGRGR